MRMNDEQNVSDPKTNAAGKPKTVYSTQPRLAQLHEVRTRASSALKGRGRRIVFGVMALILAALAGFGGGTLASNNNTFSSASLSDQKKIVSNQGELISQISKTVGPSAVSITTNLTTTTSSDIFGFGGGSQNEQAAGTGMIISKSGVIMTNRHVVPAGTNSVSVTLSDGTTFDDVKVLGRTNSGDSLDIAFLKITNLKGKKLTPVTIGDSSQASVGDSVVAIGNALGQFQNTVTSGIISGFGRQVQASSGGSAGGVNSSSEDLDNLIQTDAAINEGNSGGPLVNLNGQVIGINTAIASGAQNIGFSIPVNDVKGLIDQVLTTGKFERPYLGVRYLQLTNEIAKQYGIEQTSGAYILPDAVSGGQSPVISGSPADQAGLQGGDVITKVGSDGVTTKQSLTTLLNNHKPGDTVKLSVVRGSKTLNILVKLGVMPAN